MRILVLGTGLQGRATLQDLARSPAVSHVIAADADLAGLRRYLDRLNAPKIEPVGLDAREHDQVTALMRKVQAVIVLLPVSFHVPITRLAVESGIHLVNSSYVPPEFHEIGQEAAGRGLAILPELGFDPGIDLVLASQAVKELDEVHEFYSYGAGFPEPRAAAGPLRYKISWTFEGVLKSYVRDARVIREGKAVAVPGREIFAPSNIHTVDMEEYGPLEAYPNGDVVHYLDAMGVAAAVEHAGRFAMRWPGHCAFWYAMARLGFLDQAPIQAGGASVAPRDFVRSLLEPQLQYAEDERDVAVIRVDVRGVKNGRRRRILYQVIDLRDLSTGLLAMNRTVGYTASIGAQMILRGDIRKRGLLSPLTDIPADTFLAELRGRGISVRREAGDWQTRESS
ncbi:MAG TPA: saccharopine dehydrogenase C-terminal domain-containing protein [Candidatus Methylomirabilis sp.]|nr:saccharopine dehydrogenase C-terminal domain-containing protein [Candidatus Methylomirabilis sp.]